MRHRKETAWKKNRKLGDIQGGRCRPRMADNIFRRAHSLKRPGEGQDLPIIIEENPGRDFFFPIPANEALQAMRSLPDDPSRGLTHLWWRRPKKSDFEAGHRPWAEIAIGSGVSVITLYPWPNDMCLELGPKKPRPSLLQRYAPFTADLVHRSGTWSLRFDEEGIRRFYIQRILFHQLGLYVDFRKRHWSQANRRATEDFADQFAAQMSAQGPFLFQAPDAD